MSTTIHDTAEGAGAHVILGCALRLHSLPRLETGPLTESGAFQCAYTGWPASPGIFSSLPPPIPQYWGYSAEHHGFGVVPGVWSQVLMLAHHLFTDHPLPSLQCV